MTRAVNLASAGSIVTESVGTAPGYMARAWVNFNGTGTVAIRASGNVSSITDFGVGRFGVNFIDAMPDVDYVMSGSAGNFTGTTTANRSINRDGEWTTLQCQIRNVGDSAAVYDDEYIGVAIFR